MKKSLSLLTVAVLATMAGGVNAYTLTTGTDVVEDDFSYHGTETDVFGISVTGDETNASFTGSTIDVSTTCDSTTAWSYAAVVNGNMDYHPVLNLGGPNTQSITLHAEGAYAVGLVALNGGMVNVQSKNLNIHVTAETELVSDAAVYGILAQNSTTNGDPKASHLVIDAENTSVTVDYTGKLTDKNSVVAIGALSEGKLTINGNLYASGPDVLATRGNAVVRINESNDRTVQLNGNIDFDYDGQTSGTGIDADVLINLSGSNSYWNGSVYKSWQPTNPDSNKLVVSGFKLGLSDGAQWTPAFVDSVNEGTHGQEQIAVNKLAFNDGIINLVNVDRTVKVESMTGTGGTINVAAKRSQDGTFTTAELSVDEIVSDAGGTTSLSMNYTGITADDLSDPAADLKELGEKSLTLGQAQGVEQVRTVEEGDIRGSVTQIVDKDGTVTGTTTAANVKLADYSSLNAMSLVQWRNEINHLTKRLGDIRAAEGSIGAWARVYGGESQWGSGNEVEMDHTTIQVGGDYRVNNHWIVGGAFSYTDSDADLAKGAATGDSYSLAAYATYMADGGSFLDLIARYGYLKNDIDSGNMSLETGSSAFSLTAEMGHTFRFMEERAYIEPQVEFTYGFVSGDDDTASNGVKIEQDDFQSFVTRIGVRTGFDFPKKAGTIYGMVSYSYDFLGDADGMASEGNLRQALSEDLGGGWVSYGIGAQVMFGKSSYFYGELERTSGGEVDNPYLFNAGVRITF